MSNQTDPGSATLPTGQPPPGVGGGVMTLPPGIPSDPSMLPHDDRGPEIRAAVWILAAVAGVFLGLRLYCRLRKNRRLLWEDWVLVASFACLLVQGIMVNRGVGMGYGHHFWDVLPEKAEPIALNGLITMTVVVAGQVWSKTSFAMTLLRIAKDQTRYIVWFVIVSINIFMGLGAAFLWVQCTPIDKAWKPLMQGGTCWEPSININYGIFASVYSGASDLALALLSWKIVMGLQLKTAEKLGAAFAMSLGAFAGITGFVKASQLHTLSSPDFNYEGAGLVIWGAAEMAITIIAASIPVMRVFVRDVVSSRGYFWSGSSGAKHQQRGGGGGAPASDSSNNHRGAGNDGLVSPFVHKGSPGSAATREDLSWDEALFSCRSSAGTPRQGDVEEAASYELSWRGDAGGISKTTTVVIRRD